MYGRTRKSHPLDHDGSREWRRTGLYLLAGLAVFAFGLWRSLTPRDPLIHPGDSLSTFSMDLDGQHRPNLEEGRWTWIFFNFDDLLPVAERAARWSAISEAKPRVLLLTPGTTPPAATEPALEIIPTRAVSSTILAKFGGLGGSRRALLLNPRLEVVFAARFLQAPDIDALYRRHLGLTEFDLGEVRLSNFTGRDGQSFTGPAVWFVFHQGCSSCSLSLAFETLRDRWSELAPSCHQTNQPCSVVVDPHRDISEIQAQLREGELPLGVSSVAGLDRLLGPQDLWFSEALVVEWDGSGRLTRRRSLSAFLTEGQRGSSPTVLEGEGIEVQLPVSTTAHTSRIADLGFAHSGTALGILDGDENSLRVVEQGAIVRDFGAIGVRRGELFYPEAFDWLASGGIVVHDAGNGRLELFDESGLPTGEIRPSTKAVGLASGSDGSIFLGEPGAGHLGRASK
jgi:hypothetical protein